MVSANHASNNWPQGVGISDEMDCNFLTFCAPAICTAYPVKDRFHSTMESWWVREAVPRDIPSILQMIKVIQFELYFISQTRRV